VKKKSVTKSIVPDNIMNSELTENPTRKKIIMLLKKNREMTVEDLSKEIKITAMGVRQHLLILERNGIVEYVTRKQGVGRPGFLYKLTEYAENLFPKNYQELAEFILTDISEREGRERIMDIFRRRKEKLFNERIRFLSEKTELRDRVTALAELLDKEGNMVELDENERYFKIKQYNCPIHKVAMRFKEACINDRDLIKELTGSNGVIHQERISDGAQACIYLIPK
jgi:DeoR family suf operon transcriptional repressor